MYLNSLHSHMIEMKRRVYLKARVEKNSKMDIPTVNRIDSKDSEGATSTQSVCAASVTSKMAASLNKLRAMKELLFVHNTPKNEWFRVNFVKHVRYMDKVTGEMTSAVHLDTSKFTFCVPTRQRDYLLENLFGVKDDGEPVKTKSAEFYEFQKMLNTHYAVFPGLRFRINEVTEDKQTYTTVSFESALQCDQEEEGIDEHDGGEQ